MHLGPGLQGDGVEKMEGKWTAKMLRTNEGVREVVNTLLELAYMPPHKSFHVGKACTAAVTAQHACACLESGSGSGGQCEAARGDDGRAGELRDVVAAPCAGGDPHQPWAM